MKNNRLIDFQNYEVDPSPALWKKIEAELPGKKKRRFLFFWFMAAFVASVAGIFLFDGDDKTSSPGVSHVENKNQGNFHKEMAVETSQVNNVFIAANDNTFIDTDKKIVASVDHVNQQRIQKKQINKFASPTIVSVTVDDNNVYENNHAESNVVAEGNEGLDFLLPLSKEFNVENEYNIADKTFDTKKKKRISRWSIYAGGMISESDYKSFEDTTDEYTDNIRGLTSRSFTGGINFDISTHFRISAGVTSIDKGQVRSGVSTIILKGPPGNNSTLSITTPLGNITGNSVDLIQNFTASGDSLVFGVTSVVNSQGTTDSVQTKSFSLSEKLSYVEFPLMITYRMSERRITPFGGILFSPSYLSDHKILINGNELNYDYQDKLKNWNYSAGVVAGFDVRLIKRLSLFVNGFYQKNLNSITYGDNKWKPKVIGLNGGITFRL